MGPQRKCYTKNSVFERKILRKIFGPTKEAKIEELKPVRSWIN